MFLKPFWAPFSVKSQSKNTLFFLRGSWSLSGAILGSFLAVFGTLSGGLECYPGTTLQQFWHIFKNKDIRYRSSLGRLLEGVLAQFGTSWTPKWSQKSLKKELKKEFNFGLLFGVILGVFWSSFWDLKQLKKGTKN